MFLKKYNQEHIYVPEFKLEMYSNKVDTFYTTVYKLLACCIKKTTGFMQNYFRLRLVEVSCLPKRSLNCELLCINLQLLFLFYTSEQKYIPLLQVHRQLHLFINSCANCLLCSCSEM